MKNFAMVAVVSLDAGSVDTQWTSMVITLSLKALSEYD
jgi:hypothetical protein